MSKHTSLLGTIKHGLKVWKLYSKAIDIYHENGGNKMLDFLIERLGERSTWLGLVALAGSLGMVIAPELAEAIVVAGLAIVGLIATATKDKT